MSSPGRSSSPAWTAAAGLAAVVAAGGAVAMLLGLVSRAGEDLHAVTATTLLVGGAAAALTLAGAGVAVVNERRDVVLLSALATLLCLAALAMSVLGILLLPLILLAVVALAHRMGDPRGLLLPLGAGPAIGLGIAVLFVVWVQPPLVRCHERGATTTSRPWWDSASGTGTGPTTGAPLTAGPSRTTGTLETPAGTYRYACDGGHLTEFRHMTGER